MSTLNPRARLLSTLARSLNEDAEALGWTRVGVVVTVTVPLDADDNSGAVLVSVKPDTPNPHNPDMTRHTCEQLTELIITDTARKRGRTAATRTVAVTPALFYVDTSTGYPAYVLDFEDTPVRDIARAIHTLTGVPLKSLVLGSMDRALDIDLPRKQRTA